LAPVSASCSAASSPTSLSWRVGFYVNVPIGILMMLAASRHLAETERHSGQFDIAGALSSTLGVTALVYGIVRSPTAGWTDPVTVAALATGALLLALFVLGERRAAQPIMPLRLLAGGLTLTLIGMAWLSRLSAETPYLTGIALPMVLIGGGQGATLSLLTASRIAGVAPEDAGAASGLVNVAHQLGGSLGLGILVTIFAAAGSAALDPVDLLAHRVSTSLTAGTGMLALALALLVIALIVRPGKAAEATRNDPIGQAAPASDNPARVLTEALTAQASAA
jgi:MFS family permease